MSDGRNEKHHGRHERRRLQSIAPAGDFLPVERIGPTTVLSFAGYRIGLEQLGPDGILIVLLTADGRRIGSLGVDRRQTAFAVLSEADGVSKVAVTSDPMERDPRVVAYRDGVATQTFILEPDDDSEPDGPGFDASSESED